MWLVHADREDENARGVPVQLAGLSQGLREEAV